MVEDSDLIAEPAETEAAGCSYALPESGEMRPFTIRVEAHRLPPGDVEWLTAKTARHAGRQALEAGIADAVERGYAARWCAAKSRPPQAWQARKIEPAYFRRAVPAVIACAVERRITPGAAAARLLDWAEELAERIPNMNFPAPSLLGGPASRASFPEWLAPAERGDGLPPGVIVLEMDREAAMRELMTPTEIEDLPGVDPALVARDRARGLRVLDNDGTVH